MIELKKRIAGVLAIISLIIFIFVINNYTQARWDKLLNNIENTPSPTASVMENIPLATNSIMENVTVHFIDVGQGDCIFIQLPNNETALIDAGSIDDGKTIVDYINSCGYNYINYLIATHPHADHIGGMPYIIENLSIGKMYMPEKAHTTKTFENMLIAIENKNVPVTKAEKGVIILNDEKLNINILSPVKDYYSDLNNYSAVIKVVYGDVSFLFMGDGEKEVENDILNDNIKADILKVGHHGSNTSSTSQFLNTVKPRYAIISCGLNNKYNLPDDDVIYSLVDIGTDVCRTCLLYTSPSPRD